MSNPGRLGWIREINCWSVLIEICFLTNTEDMTALHAENGYDKVAIAITEALADVFGITLKKDNSCEAEKETITKLNEENVSLKKIINQIMEYLSSFLKP